MNLIICFTPLQMLIAEKIIDKKELKNNILFVVTYTDNDKFRFYYNRLSEKCIYSYFFLVNEKNLLTRLFSIIKLKKIVSSLPVKKFDACYLASIDSSYIQLITSNVKFNQLYTFDDGSINLVKNSIYYHEKNYSFFGKVFRYFLNISYTVSDYKEQSLIHYTIFNKTSNITDRTEFINLVDHNILDCNKKEYKRVRIFIGQPINEINIKKEFLINFLHYKNIDFYFPHPREKEVFSGIKYLYSNKIFEEFLLTYLNENPNVELEIYTFFSSVILNIKDIDRVNVCSIYHDDIPKFAKSIYNIFKENNISVEEVS